MTVSGEINNACFNFDRDLAWAVFPKPFFARTSFEIYSALAGSIFL